MSTINYKDPSLLSSPLANGEMSASDKSNLDRLSGILSLPEEMVIIGGTDGYVFRQLTMDDILPGFSISGFGTNYSLTIEIGQTLNGIQATVSYSSQPISATVNDNLAGVWNATDGTYTLFLRSGSWIPLTIGANLTATLSATAATTKTATWSIYAAAFQYWGLGSGGVLTSAQIRALAGSSLSTGLIGSFVVSPANQKVYFAVPTVLGNVHMTLGGFAFDMLPPVTVNVINQYGITVPCYLYESTNLLTGTNLNLTVISGAF